MFIPTFAVAVDSAHAEFSKGWSDKTSDAFKSSMMAHAVPALGKYLVSEISGAQIISALAPIWTKKPQQARKVRHRILQVLSYSKSRGWRTEAVPEAGELRRGLAKQPRSQGFAAMPFATVPEFVEGELAKASTPARLALVFTILTAARSGEVRNMRWEHVDSAAKLWRRPADLMKSGQAHEVTLSKVAISILDQAGDRYGREGFVFPSARDGSPLSDMSLSKILRMAGRSETVHGFRSSFRDWAAEMMPNVPAMVAEMALAHAVGDRTIEAYLRSDLLKLRFGLMNAWGLFVTPAIKDAAHV